MVIPVFFVVIGGIFWVGELLLSKQKMLMADRYAAWQAGNRHKMNKGTILSDVQNTFFRHEEVGDQFIDGIKYQAVDPTTWYTPVGATAILWVQSPEWTKGWLAGSPTWEGVVPPKDLVKQMGRDPNQASHHVLLMRNRFGDFAYRSPFWTPKQLADWGWPWHKLVYLDKWPRVNELFDFAPQGLLISATPGGPPGYTYERHSAYVDWSH